MFLHLCVILFTGEEGGGSAQPPVGRPGGGKPPWRCRPLGRPPWMGRPPPRVGQTPPGWTDSPRGWAEPPPTPIRSISGRYQSYWNAYLFCMLIGATQEKLTFCSFLSITAQDSTLHVVFNSDNT